MTNNKEDKTRERTSEIPSSGQSEIQLQQVIQAVTFQSPIVGGYLKPWKGSRELTIPKKVAFAELPGNVCFTENKFRAWFTSKQPYGFIIPSREVPSGKQT